MTSLTSPGSPSSTESAERELPKRDVAKEAPKTGRTEQTREPRDDICRGSWGVAAADVEHGCQLWAKPLSTPAAGGSPAPDKGTLRQLQQLASGVGAPDSPKPQPDSPKVDSIEVVACSDRRRSVSACLPLQCLWRPGLPAAQQDAGLLMTAESSGVVSTLGWCPQYSPAECRAHHEARGMTFWGSDAANMLPTVFPDRSAANLGAPLVVLLRGSLVPAVEEEVAPISFLAAGSCGQVFSVENLEPEEAFLLRAVESVLQEHAIAQPLNLSHSDYRRGTSTVKKERLIIDGDLLGEYQHLPQESQESIATSLQITLGRPFQPAGIVALLRKWV